MALLKKTLHTISEKMGCGDDENSGTALMSFLVRRNQAEEEETAHKAAVMKMVGDDDELELGDESDATNMDTDDPEANEMDPDMDDEMNPMDDPEGEMDMDMDMDADQADQLDPDSEEDPDADVSGQMGGAYSDADIEQEGDDEKRLGMIQSLLSMKR